MENAIHLADNLFPFFILFYSILLTMNYQCYYCSFQIDVENPEDEDKYIEHGVKNHFNRPIFPNEGDLAKRKLKPQGKRWEKYDITIEEVDKRLASWAAKSKKRR